VVDLSRDSSRGREQVKCSEAHHYGWRSAIPRDDSPVSKLLGRYSGTVRKQELGYLFVRSSAYPEDIYGQHDQATPDDWLALTVGTEMNFLVRFTRSGPVTVDMKPGRISLNAAA
jgi:hypothetical protein